MPAASKVRQTLTTLAAQQEALLTRVESATDAERRVWQSGPETWSLAQVVQHLGMSASELLKTERPRNKKGSKAKFLVMRAVLKSPARLKLPPGVPITPAPTVTWDEAVALTRTALQAWSAYLETQRDDVVFMHPFAGPLSAEQTVTFLHDHFHHHVPQVERLLAKSKA